MFFGAHLIGKVNAVSHLFHKMEHFLYYGAMALLLARGLGRRWFWIALFAIPLVGALDEWHQLYIPGRNSSVYDWIADLAGTIVFVGAYWQLSVRKSNAVREEVGLRPQK